MSYKSSYSSFTNFETIDCLGVVVRARSETRLNISTSENTECSKSNRTNNINEFSLYILNVVGMSHILDDRNQRYHSMFLLLYSIFIPSSSYDNLRKQVQSHHNLNLSSLSEQEY